MTDEGRRRRLLAQVGEFDTPLRAEEVAELICRFAMDQFATTGCGVMLMSPPSSVDVLASAGSLAAKVAELQFTLGEGPCLDAYTWGAPVFATDLVERGSRWPMFSAAVTELGVRAEFSLPLQVGAAGLGTLDMFRGEPGMLTEDELADALTAAELATDAVLMMQSAAEGADLSRLLEWAGVDRLVVHQATGMIAVQGDFSTADALASLRAAAFRSGRSIRDIAVDVVDRRLTFRD